MSLSPRCRRRGLTLFELLVLLALLVLFLGFFLAAVGGVRKAAGRSQSQNNLKQITIATIDCADAHQGKLPRGPAFWYPQDRLAAQNGYGPCLFQILPYMDQDTLYKSSLTKLGDTQVYAGWALAGKPVKTFQGPADPTQDPRADRTSYLANGLAFPRNRGMTYPASFTDGTSQTILFAEAYSVATDNITWGGKTQAWKTERRWWDDPTWEPVLADLPFQVAPAKDAAASTLPQGPTPYGIMVSLGDASVRLVSGKVSATTFYAACTPNQSDVLGSDW
jgi:hypothetical protein